MKDFNKALMDAVIEAETRYEEAVNRMVLEASRSAKVFREKNEYNWQKRHYLDSLHLNVAVYAGDIVRAAGRLQAARDAVDAFLRQEGK